MRATTFRWLIVNGEMADALSYLRSAWGEFVTAIDDSGAPYQYCDCDYGKLAV